LSCLRGGGPIGGKRREINPTVSSNLTLLAYIVLNEAVASFGRIQFSGR